MITYKVCYWLSMENYQVVKKSIKGEALFCKEEERNWSD